MARFVQVEAKKGSQKWIQKMVNEKPEILATKIWSSLNLAEERIDWLSPLKNDDYAEYRDQAFLDRLEIKLEKSPLGQFWPRGGPQWDALGRSTSGRLFLVEAKSHISELISSIHAKDEKSREMIRQSLYETREYLNASTKIDWSQCFYQYTNRLAHLFLLRQKNDLPAYLIHVYFLNDAEMNGPTTSNEWQGAIRMLDSCLGIERHKLRKFMSDLYIDVRAL